MHGGGRGKQSQKNPETGKYDEITWNTINKMAARYSGDRPIMLLSCRTGFFSAGRAQANALSANLENRPVMISNSQVWHQTKDENQYARAYWSTNGTGLASTNATRDTDNPGYFRFINGKPSDFGFIGLDSDASRVHTIQVDISSRDVTMIAHDSKGRYISSTRSQ